MGKILTTEILRDRGACAEGIEAFKWVAGGDRVEITEEWARENPFPFLDWEWFAIEFLSANTYAVYRNARRDLIGLEPLAYCKERAALIVRLYNEE